MLSTQGKQRFQSQKEFVRNLKAGEHGCMFFVSEEDFKNVQFEFVKSGLEQNWGVVCATATEIPDQVRTRMKHYGIDVQKYETNESLVILRGEDLYKDPENPDLQAWTSAARSVCEGFMAKGKRGVRIAADLSSYFLSKGLTKQWFQLEYALERKFATPLTVICGYDARLIPASKDLDIIEYYKLVNREQRDYVDAHSFAIYSNNNKTMILTI
jgi:hypothetical protein